MCCCLVKFQSILPCAPQAAFVSMHAVLWRLIRECHQHPLAIGGAARRRVRDHGLLVVREAMRLHVGLQALQHNRYREGGVGLNAWVSVFWHSNNRV